MMMCPPQDPLHKVEIQFPVGDQTVSDLFHQKLQESESVIHCIQCAQDFNQREKLQFIDVSDILIISVQRTVYDQQKNQDRKITLPLNIGGDLDFKLPDGDTARFKLISGIEHQGSVNDPQDPRGGHFVNHLSHQQRTLVINQNSKIILSKGMQDCQVLFYQRIHDENYS